MLTKATAGKVSSGNKARSTTTDVPRRPRSSWSAKAVAAVGEEIVRVLSQSRCPDRPEVRERADQISNWDAFAGAGQGHELAHRVPFPRYGETLTGFEPVHNDC